MPIYEYECRSCGKRTELLQRMADAPLAACPQCGGPVKKLISSPAFQFKGSGWYVTDYAGKKSGAETKSEDKGEGGKADKKEEKSEKKEAVAETKSSSGSGSSGSSDS